MRRVPAIDLSRSRDLGDILGTTFSLYRKNFGLFAGIAFAVVIPMDLLAYALPRTTIGLAFALIPWLVAVPLITAGHVCAVMTLGERRDVFAGDSLRAAARRLPAIAATVFLTSVATLLGCILLVLPGIYVGVRLYFSTQAVMAEGFGAGEGMERSWELVKGSFWRTFGILILVSIAAAVLAA